MCFVCLRGGCRGNRQRDGPGIVLPRQARRFVEDVTTGAHRRDVPWREKAPRLFWRGDSTGGEPGAVPGGDFSVKGAAGDGWCEVYDGGHLRKAPTSGGDVKGSDDLKPEDQRTVDSVIAGTYDYHSGGGAGAGAGAGAAGAASGAGSGSV